ncbi:hypothetical protein U1Q18_018902 [Sarracenia purpurea var. burkii]
MTSPFPFIEHKEDQQRQFFSPPHQVPPSLASPIFFNITDQDQREHHPRQAPQANHHHKAGKYIVDGGSNDRKAIIASSSVQPTVDTAKNSHELSIYKLQHEAEDHKRDYKTERWMPSKMRLIRKMTNTMARFEASRGKKERIVQKFGDQEQDDGGINSPITGNNIVIRVCSDCKTTKTPLWRSGPQGPKSLCNACGIRQRKARRAMLVAAAAAEASGNGVVFDDHADKSTGTKVRNKVKKSRTGYIAQYENKAVKLPGPTVHGGEKISFEDFALSLSKNSAFRRAFPKDEEEAAILLMALSCGLLHS